MKEIEKIIKAYHSTDWNTEKAALGTVVKVEESAYRRIGARMYVRSMGDWTGGISGGCLEGDALKRAQIAINKNESSIVVYDTMDDDSHQIGVGLGCNGRIEVMFTPIDPNDPDNPIEFLKTITATRQTEALIQILDNPSGAKPQVGSFYPISKLDQLVTDSDIDQNEIIKCVAEARLKRKSRTFKLTSSHGIQLELLVELIRPKIKVVCVGDNYDVNAFVSIVHELGWEIHIAGKLRKLSKDLFQIAASVQEYKDASKIVLDEHTAVVLMSHDYKTDLELLQYFVSKKVRYIGLLGPRKRMLKMQKELAENGNDVLLDQLAHLFAPVGLDIGAESPEEIALSIAAEIVAALRKREGTPLRKRIGPIHERD